MSGPVLIIVIGAVWLSIGLVLSLVLGRRGHDRFTWLVLGTLLGPRFDEAVRLFGAKLGRVQLFGRTARQLASSSPVPVLLLGPAARRRARAGVLNAVRAGSNRPQPAVP